MSLSPTRIRALRKIARDAVEAVAPSVVDRHHNAPKIATRRKGAGDFVTAVDIAAEKQLRRILLEATPEAGFLGEESSPSHLDAEIVWIVDPIDGTSNFAQGLPSFAVSLACWHRGRPVAAAVHCCPQGETLHAGQNLGAHLGRQRLKTTRCRLDDAAVVGVQWHRGAASLGFLDPLVVSGTRVRVFGSTVTQICDVARGRLHANLQQQGKIWDFAAAVLIAAEAGLKVSDWQGRKLLPITDLDAAKHYPSLVAPAGIHGQLVKILRDIPLIVPAP